jgi:hypothetical protein
MLVEEDYQLQAIYWVYAVKRLLASFSPHIASTMPIVPSADPVQDLSTT